MLPRSLFLVPLLATGFLAAPAAADRLLVGGSDGFVMQADMAQGEFAYFACACLGGSISALAADGERLYAAGDFGQLLVSDVESGALQGLFWLDVGQINALAAADGAVFAGTEAGEVVRVDPASGLVIDTRTAPSGVRALIAHGGFLLAAGADGAVYRAPVTDGEFEYFTCFCFSNIQDMAIVGNDLLIGDGFGTVARVSLQSGNIVTAFWVGALDSMTASRGALLTYYAGAGGVIPRFSANTGEQLSGEFMSPINVRAMLVIRAEKFEGPKVKQAPSPAQLP